MCIKLLVRVGCVYQENGCPRGICFVRRTRRLRHIVNELANFTIIDVQLCMLDACVCYGTYIYISELKFIFLNYKDI